MGDSVAVTVVATDDDGDPLTFTATGLPAGVEVDQATGQISGTPTQAGVFAVTVTADDGEDSGTAGFAWTIEDAAPIAFTCTVVNGVLSWTDIGVDRYSVREVNDGVDSFLAIVDGSTSLTLTGNADQYLIRARSNGQTTDSPVCAGNPDAGPAAAAFACEVVNRAGTFFLTWTDQERSQYNIGQTINGTRTFITTISDPAGANAPTELQLNELADSYDVRTRPNGELLEATCTAPKG